MFLLHAKITKKKLNYYLHIEHPEVRDIKFGSIESKLVLPKECKIATVKYFIFSFLFAMIFYSR